MSTTEPTPESLELGRRLKAARIAAGFTTQSTAAAALGKPREFINRMEAGKVVPFTPTLFRVILGLRLDPMDIFPEAAAWAGKPAADRWPEGHPDARLLETSRRGAPRGPRPPKPGPKRRRQPPRPANPNRRWPEGYATTLRGRDIRPDPDTATKEGRDG